MAGGAIAAKIIGDILGAGATLTSGILGARSTRESNEQQYDLAMLERSDTMRENELDRRVQRAQMRQDNRHFYDTLDFNREQFAWEQGEGDANREERQDDRLYGRRQETINRWLSMVNNDANHMLALQGALKRAR